jgi:hypothetical protein
MDTTFRSLTDAERLRELTWLYTTEEIAAAAGVAVAVIDGLCGSETAGNEGRAIRRAWCRLAPPDVDEVAVDRVLDGDSPARLTVAERREAVRRLVFARRTTQEIAEQVGVDARTVCRIVASLGLHRQPLLAEGSRMSFRHAIARRTPWMDGPG